MDFGAILPLWNYGLEKITLDPLHPHPMMPSQGLEDESVVKS